MSNDLTNPNSQLPAEWAERLAVYAKETASAELRPGNFFSTRAGTLTFAGSPIAGNKMEVCVLGSMHENVYYAESFNADAPASPGCYAFSFDGKNMQPHDEADQKQSKTCATCPKNAWGSGDNGRGKACKEQRRLALLPAGSLTDPSGVAGGMMGLLRIPVTSVKYWSAYASKLAVEQLPPFAVVTEISLTPNPKTMIQFNFRHVRTINDQAVLNALVARIAMDKIAMSAPYPHNNQAPATPTPHPVVGTPAPGIVAPFVQKF